MRLKRLDLTRYGKFTNDFIDFGEPVEGQADLHIVYGPNEAGKSTALSAFLDLLFGIEAQSRYDFLHPYQTMRVGGCLDLSIGRRELIRVKRRQNSLLDNANDPVPDGLILGDLGGIDRNAYRTMFSLDDDTLEAGGKSILASNGELGQLLFSASAGLADLSKTLFELRAETDGFTKPNARSGELADYKATLLKLRDECEAIDTLASEHSRLVVAGVEAARLYNAAHKERTETHAELSRLQRLLAAIPVMAALRRDRKRVVEFGDLPAAPPGWLDSLPKLQQAETRQQIDVEFAEKEVKRLAEEARDVVVDEPALRLLGHLDRLEGLRVRFIGAEADLPDRRRDLRAVEGEIARLLAHLDQTRDTDPQRLLLSAAQSATLSTLIATRSGIDEKVAAATEELAQAAQALTEARRSLSALAVPTGALPSLTAVKVILSAIRDSDHAVRLRQAKRSLAQDQVMVPTRLATLTPWQGNLEDLARLAVPDVSAVLAWQTAAQTNSLKVEQQMRAFDEVEGDVSRRRAQIDAAGRIGGLLSDADAAEIRSAREAAWSAHRRALNLGTANEFEAALRKDDIAGTTRLGHEREVAKLNEALQSLAVREVALARADASLVDARGKESAHLEFVSGTISKISPQLSADMKLATLLIWISNREKALELALLMDRTQRDVADAEVDGAALREKVLVALRQAAIPHDAAGTLEDLQTAAQDAVDLEAKVQSLREATEECERQMRSRELAIQRASKFDKAWDADWRKACDACWIGVEAAAHPVDVVREMIDAAAALAPMLSTRNDLQGRISAMEDDRNNFAEEVTRLAADIGLGWGWDDALDVAQGLMERVAVAGRAAVAKRTLEEATKEAEKNHRQLASDAKIHSQRVAEMMGHMRAASLIELAGKLADAEAKSNLEHQADLAEQDVLSILHVETIAEADAQLAHYAVPQLETEITSRSTRLEALDARTRELFAAQSKAEDEIAAVGGDDAVARIKERQRTTALELEEKALGYLRLRAGTVAADRALRLYRDQHRSSMMTHASEAFTVISQGAYRGLGVQPEREGDILVALGANGGSKRANDLSKGTRFQLYLALRAAGYREFTRVRPPVPFIADDIMETFDDLRATETLRMLGSMALLGQVIYLTHHDHLRVIAEATVPSVRIHHLTA